MFDVQVLAFIVVAAALTISPGADTLLVVRNTITRGWADGVMTAFGICSGLFVHATLSALGLSLILTHSAFAYQVLKIAGACYLVWLGFQSLRSALTERDLEAGTTGAGVRPIRPSRRAFIEGLLTNVLNPKVAVFYLAFLPQFISIGDPVFAKSILLAAIHALMGVVWLGALAALLERMRLFFASPRIRRLLEGVSGAILIGLGARLAIVQR